MLRTIIREYTREAGVRNLERRLADVCRKAATQVAKGKTQKTRVDDKRLREWLGAAALLGRGAAAHVAAGRRDRPRLHRRPAATCCSSRRRRIPGKGDLIVTGQLGDVMKESAQAALSWVRSHTDELGVEDNWFEEHDIHIHVPAGRRAEGRAVGRRHDRDGDRVARPRRAGRRRRRDDRRDHAHRPGAADRRHPREVARRAARRPEAGDPAARERERPRASCRPRPARRSSSSRPTRSRTCSPRRSTASGAGVAPRPSRGRAPGRAAACAGAQEQGEAREELAQTASTLEQRGRAAGTRSCPGARRRSPRLPADRRRRCGAARSPPTSTVARGSTRPASLRGDAGIRASSSRAAAAKSAAR